MQPPLALSPTTDADTTSEASIKPVASLPYVNSDIGAALIFIRINVNSSQDIFHVSSVDSISKPIRASLANLSNPLRHRLYPNSHNGRHDSGFQQGRSPS